MTAFDRFDPFERRIADAVDEIAAARLPDYLDDIFQLTARESQRPRWTFLERWLPVDTTLRRGPAVGPFPTRSLLLLLLLLAIVAGAIAAYAGARRVPAPFGPAANGGVAYTSNGDLYIKDSISGQAHLLIGGPGDQVRPAFSPDGTWLSFVTTRDGADHFSVVKADGSSAHELAVIPATGNAQAAWAPDSRHLALIYDVQGRPQLSIADVEGGSTRVIDVGELRPREVAWRPPNGGSLLIRAQSAHGPSVGLYTLSADGSGLTAVGPTIDSAFGPDVTSSGLAWSPDGTRFAYNSIDRGDGKDLETVYHFRLHIANADGSGDLAVPAPESAYIQEGWPAFSPDGRTILVHRWQFKGDAEVAGDPEGWLAVMPSDGSAPARDIGPRIPGGEDTGLQKLWSPDGTRVIVTTSNTRETFSIDPVTGAYELLPWAVELPDWQRKAP